MSSPQPGPSRLQNVYSDDESDDSLIKDIRKKKQKMIIEDSDSSDMEYQDNININFDKTDSESSEMMFGETDNESDVGLESEELDEPFEYGEDIRKWICNSDLKKFSFEGKPGLQKLPKEAEADNYFELMFDENFFSMIVTETNKYAESVIGSRWEILSIAEFRTFLGLLLHMGTIRCPKIENYWNTSRLFGLNTFSQHMSRHRFQDILRSLHFSSNNESNHRLREILPIIDYFNNKMKETYYPHRELSIDETMTPWRGRLACGQHSTRKKHKYGVRLYVLSESSGIAMRIRPYTGSRDDISGKGHVTKLVLYLLDNFLQKGHSVFMKNFYTSFTLVEKLLNSKTYCTGTLRKLRKGNNEDVIKAKLLKSEMISRYKNKIMMGKFRDKREVLFISSEYRGDLVEFENKRKGKVKKPLALSKYNEFMNGIDRKDQMLTYYTCSRRTFKWYIKLWIHLVETLLLNSFYLYSKYSPSKTKLNFYDFRLKIIDTLLFKSFQEYIPPILEKPDHLPEMLSRGENNKIKRKRCRQCFAKGLRKETNYFCIACKDNPGLCLGKCFSEYHKDK